MYGSGSPGWTSTGIGAACSRGPVTYSMVCSVWHDQREQRRRSREYQRNKRALLKQLEGWLVLLLVTGWRCRLDGRGSMISYRTRG